MTTDPDRIPVTVMVTLHRDSERWYPESSLLDLDGTRGYTTVRGALKAVFVRLARAEKRATSSSYKPKFGVILKSGTG